MTLGCLELLSYLRFLNKVVDISAIVGIDRG